MEGYSRWCGFAAMNLSHDTSPEDEAIGMVIAVGFRLQQSRLAAALDCAWGGLVA